MVDLKLGGWISYETPQALLTFGHVLLNSCCSLASECSRSSCTFPNKLLIGLTTNSLCVSLWHSFWSFLTFDDVPLNLLWDSICMINFWSCSTKFPLFPGLWLVEHFLYIYRWPQTCWVHVLWYSPGMIIFSPCFTKSLPFLWLWLICTFPVKPLIGLTLKFSWCVPYGMPKAWLTFGYPAVNYHFLASYFWGQLLHILKQIIHWMDIKLDTWSGVSCVLCLYCRFNKSLDGQSYIYTAFTTQPLAAERCYLVRQATQKDSELEISCLMCAELASLDVSGDTDR